YNPLSGETFFSEKWYTMLGYLPGEFKSSYANFMKIMHPLDRDRAEITIKESINKGSEFKLEFRLRSKSGEWEWIAAGGRPMEFNKEGKVIRLIGSHKRITEEKTLLIKRKKALDQLKLIETVIQEKKENLSSITGYGTIPEGELFSVHLKDLIDIRELQEIQDAFANATGIASIITEPNGAPITQPSNFCELCSQIIRQTEKGLRNCMNSDAEIGKYNPNGPIFKPCLSSGLWDGGASIHIGEKHIANWLIGQVLDTDADLDYLTAYADEIGADKKAYREALAKVKRMSQEQFSKITAALFLIAKQISGLAVQNYRHKYYIRQLQDTEEKLLESEEKFKLAMSSVPGFIWTVNTDLEIVISMGSAFEKMGIEQRTGKSLYEVFSTESERIDPIRYHKIALSGEPVKYEFELKDRFFEIRLEPIRVKGNDITGVLGIAYDITDRRLAQRALSESERKYRLMFEHMGHPACYLELIDSREGFIDYKFLEVNKLYEQITGLKKSDMIGKRYSELKSSFFINDRYVMRQYETAVMEKRTVKFERYHKGAEKWFSVTVFSPAGNNVVVMLEDITQRINAQAEREKLIEILENKNAEMERFIYTVSHDLRSPLITIKGFTGFMLNDAKRGHFDKLESDIQRIVSASEKMELLLEDLLELSRIGRIANPPVEFSLDELINEVIELLHGSISKHDAIIQVAGQIGSISADRQRIQEVFQNILENSLKFRKKDIRPMIKISSEHFNNRLEIIIEDNGIGIDREYLDKVFGLFNKLDQNSQGTGVGLALVKRIMEVHNGSVKIDSDGLNMGIKTILTFNKQEN
ncbi:MAG: PocR ligand-binding domain-containing protein, partial [Candidatus Kapaibacterium sp.]